MPGPAVDRQLYKATSLVFNEETEILAPRDPRQAGPPAPSKGILKNGGGVPGADRLRKAKSIETITVRPVGREAPALGPTRPLQRERQPPNSLDLSAPKKPPVPGRMKIVEEKLRFSEFLNEITQQVMSPSSLSSLGWKPPESSPAAKTPSTDGSDSKGSSVKSSSPGSSLEMPEGKATEEMGSGPRRKPGPPEGKVDTLRDRHGRRYAVTTDEASTSPESGPLAQHLGSLPILSGEGVKGQRKHAGRGMEPEALLLPFKKADKDAATAMGKSAGKEQLGKTNIFVKVRVFLAIFSSLMGNPSSPPSRWH
ncbi:hypothetical protein JRQ81_009530 [Phrynocephalus forsythii]|uniref:Uncharacterized protein n=1 Tax=Phrynocephalus forsythii TaxID=171643 RepID=A0A9Q1AS00_9SAUR|nr:hypothetical protein JRQ81_009530 [Phrynocephalus forsythii]